jgi:S1-C subfamily serine protease
MPEPIRPTGFLKSDFSAINAHVEGLINNEQQLSRVKKYRADRIKVINFGMALMFLGGFFILLAIANNRHKAPSIEIVEKPVYIDKPVYYSVKVPDANLSQVIEKPIYITKTIKVPIQITKKEGVSQEFTFFNTKEINKGGVMNVVVGASYASVNSPYPEKQWCYARSLKSISNNTSPHLDLGEKKGVAGVVYNKLTRSDASAFGATKYTLEALKRHCEFFPAISPVQTGPGGQDGDLESRFPSSPPASIGKSGTGFYINKIGYVVTNNHVVDGCSSIWVNHDKKDIPAIIIKNDKTLDIAVIKADIRTNFYAEFANKIRTGEDVMALGFPLGDKLGDEIKATKGNISAVSGVRDNKNYLQFTAPIQAGNSGGPLLNESGLVVGINTAKLIGEDYQNVNFAINGNLAQKFLGENGINFQAGKHNNILKSADLVDIGKKFTVKVLCSR